MATAWFLTCPVCGVCGRYGYDCTCLYRDERRLWTTYLAAPGPGPRLMRQWTLSDTILPGSSSGTETVIVQCYDDGQWLQLLCRDADPYPDFPANRPYTFPVIEALDAAPDLLPDDDDEDEPIIRQWAVSCTDDFVLVQRNDLEEVRMAVLGDGCRRPGHVTPWV